LHPQASWATCKDIVIQEEPDVMEPSDEGDSEGLDDEDLPVWAKRSMFDTDTGWSGRGRCSAALLPSNLSHNYH